MTPLDLDRAARHAAAWAEELGEFALAERRKGVDVAFKGKGRNDPVTAADKAVERRVRELVAKEFPGHAVLGEEQGAEDGEPDWLWVVDPIDGTSNYARGLPLWAVSIGVLHKRAPVAGAIWTPAGLDGGHTVFHAALGGGAWAGAKRLRAMQNARPEPTGMTFLPSAWAGFLKFGVGIRPIGDVRALGSIAVELAYVAAGVSQLCVFMSPKIWDVAAGALLVQEADGAALVRSPAGWRPLARYEPGKDPRGKKPDGLAFWRSAVIAGAPRVAGRAAAQISTRLPLRFRIMRIVGAARARLRRKKG